MVLRKLFLPLLFTVLLAGFYSCKKDDPAYPFTIEVKTLEDSISVNNIHVEILARVGGGLKVFFDGYTNEQGRISFTYDNEAVFLIRATRGQDPYTYIGCAEVRLEADANVTKTVYLEPYNPEVIGCTFTP